MNSIGRDLVNRRHQSGRRLSDVLPSDEHAPQSATSSRGDRKEAGAVAVAGNSAKHPDRTVLSDVSYEAKPNALRRDQGRLPQQSL